MAPKLTGKEVTPVRNPDGTHGTILLSNETTMQQVIETLRVELLKNARKHQTGTLGVGHPNLYMEVVTRNNQRYLVFEVL